MNAQLGHQYVMQDEHGVMQGQQKLQAGKPSDDNMPILSMKRSVSMRTLSSHRFIRLICPLRITLCCHTYCRLGIFSYPAHSL